jgi:hypothetical protein
MLRLLGLLLLVIAALTWPGRTAAAPPTPAGGRALLVGVTYYPNLGEAYQLKGPANDVLLMERLLREKFGFPPENITVLSEEAGSKAAERLPVRANIEREFTRLAREAREGERVFILLAGHGSQQPEAENTEDPEPDGLDEIFLPRDVAKWDGDGTTGHVPNAIIDDELGHWLKAIEAKKTSVWLIVDSCHSGTMTRGAGERAREVPPSSPDGLAIPKAALEQARKRAAQRGGGTRGAAPDKVAPIPLAGASGVVALYACQANEVTVEMVLPADSDDSKPYGLLTFTIHQILTRAAAPLTYRELARAVYDRYVDLGRTAPTPLIEGTDLDREVLGVRAWPGRSRIVVSETDTGLKVNAGALHGLTAGSVLAVYPAAGLPMADRQLGHVRVRRLRTHEADVEPCAFADAAAPKPTAVVGGRCEPVFLDYGDLRLRVAVDPEDAEGKSLAEPERRKLADALAPLDRKPGSLVRLVSAPREADWLVRYQAGKVYLLRAAEWSKARSTGQALPSGAAKEPQLLGPVAADDGLGSRLEESLGKIARAENLKRLASSQAEQLAEGDSDRVQVELQVLLHRDEKDKEGQPLDWSTQGRPVLYAGDALTVRLRNPSRVPADVTLLYIDSGFKIDPLFPKMKGDNCRLFPADVESIGGLEMDGKTVGLEHLIVIAVKGEGIVPVDFSGLAQPTIELAKQESGDRRGGDKALTSALGRLLQTALYREGTTRGEEMRDPGDHLLRRFSLEVRPGKRPAEGK